MIFDHLDWQTVVALTIVFAAIGLLVRKIWKMVFGSTASGCGTSCNSCPSSKEPGTLVQLDSKSKQ